MVACGRTLGAAASLPLLLAPGPGQEKTLVHRYGIFSIRFDGAGLRLEREVRGGWNYDKLRVSPDGARIAFLRCTEDVDGDGLCTDAELLRKELVVTDWNGENEVVVGPDEGGFNDYPCWSPDGGSVLFAHSSAPLVAMTDLFVHDLATGERRRLTNTPGFMESDNAWHPDGRITVIRQEIVDGRPRELNDVWEIHVDSPGEWRRLTTTTRSLGDHCCTADAKYSPDGRSFVFARFAAAKGETGDWDIVLRDVQSGEETDLSRNDLVDMWPMWNADGSRLLWVRWDEGAARYSIVVRDSTTGSQELITLIGKGVRWTLDGGERVVFPVVRWPDWKHPAGDGIVFAAAFVAL